MPSRFTTRVRAGAGVERTMMGRSTLTSLDLNTSPSLTITGNGVGTSLSDARCARGGYRARGTHHGQPETGHGRTRCATGHRRSTPRRQKGSRPSRPRSEASAAHMDTRKCRESTSADGTATAGEATNNTRTFKQGLSVWAATMENPFPGFQAPPTAKPNCRGDAKARETLGPRTECTRRHPQTRASARTHHSGLVARDVVLAARSDVPLRALGKALEARRLELGDGGGGRMVRRRRRIDKPHERLRVGKRHHRLARRTTRRSSSCSSHPFPPCSLLLARHTSPAAPRCAVHVCVAARSGGRRSRSC